MHRAFLLVLVAFQVNGYLKKADFSPATSFAKLKPKTTEEVQKNAAEDVIRRVVPDISGSFSVVVDFTLAKDLKDAFQITKTSQNDHVEIRASSGVAAVWAFHHYLKYFCKCHISWEATQLNLPKSLPNANITIVSNDLFRYYQNICTNSYSFPWWDWLQWEKHLDWMAMNGINFALAPIGQEAIWTRVYERLDLTNEEIKETFAGPAFLAWSRMGNIRGWGGPLSTAWHDRTLVLQKKILKRMRDLGMTPILPGFSGHVPVGFRRAFPLADVFNVTAWNHFNATYCCPLLLSPTDPMFQTVGNLYIMELLSEFGTNHAYSSDTFNEMAPPTQNPKFLSAIGQSIYAAMSTVDPEAVWVMQGWMFYSESDYWGKDLVKSFLNSVSPGKMIVLDLQSEQFPQYERLESYFGQPFIWCMLHNFGGTLGLFGSVDKINQDAFKARQMANSTMIGTGLTPEGINQNYVIYDLMLEMGWRKSPVNLSEWFEDYTIRRYGEENSNAITAWQLLKDSVYNFGGVERVRGKYSINRRPTMNTKIWTWYNGCDVMQAWKLLLDGANSTSSNAAYKHDIVDVTRQAIQIFGDYYYEIFVDALKRRDMEVFNTTANKFMELFPALEKILATSEAFLLGNWLHDAKSVAKSEYEEVLYELNARNQITLWGPNGQISDYASKQWSGLVSHYYAKRWELFLTIVIEKGGHFNETEAQSRLFYEVEVPFNKDRTPFPTTPQGDTLMIAGQIWDAYLTEVAKMCKTKQGGAADDYTVVMV